jgi:hypothetical protein
VKLRAKLAQGDGFTALRLEGVIDEHNGLAQMLLPESEVLLVDLGGVKRLNSVGVRDWVIWLRSMRARFPHVVLFDCPAPVMNEVNYVKNFAEGAHLTTFAAPLYCTRCQKEEARLLDTHRIRNGGGLSLPSFSCGRSDCENALDDDEESYFSFMRSLPDAPDHERFRRLTDEARALLVSSDRTVPMAPTALDPKTHPSPSRNQALEQVGLQGTPRKEGLKQPPLATEPALATPAEARGDWLFILAMAAMLAVLAVLIYLILTLE